MRRICRDQQAGRGLRARPRADFHPRSPTPSRLHPSLSVRAHFSSSSPSSGPAAAELPSHQTAPSQTSPSTPNSPSRTPQTRSPPHSTPPAAPRSRTRRIHNRHAGNPESQTMQPSSSPATLPAARWRRRSASYCQQDFLNLQRSKSFLSKVATSGDRVTSLLL